MSYHVPVLLNESVEGLKIQPDGIYVDLTYGGGGHSEEILKRLKKGALFAFDQDKDALKNTRNDSRLTLIHGNFRYMKNFLKFYGVESVNGILADLGVSSFHIDEFTRGFSYRLEGPLDMRMNQEGKLTAQIVLQSYPSEELVRIFLEYGEIHNSLRLVSLIEQARQQKSIATIPQFLEIIKPCIPNQFESKYLSKVFQALRIEVNQEIEALKQMLVQSLEVLKPAGRLVVIAYHSLEDRLVKNFMKSGNFEGERDKDFFGKITVPFTLINKKVIIPGEEELRNNSRARSARLRISEKN